MLHSLDIIVQSEVSQESFDFFNLLISDTVLRGGLDAHSENNRLDPSPGTTREPNVKPHPQWLADRDLNRTGRVITWEEISQSELNLFPESYQFGPAPQRAVPIPGSARPV